VAAQAKYAARLRELVQEMAKTVKAEVTQAFGARYGAQDAAADDMTELLKDLGERFRAMFAKRAEPLADDMVRSAEAASTVGLRNSLEVLSGGLTLPTGTVTERVAELRAVAVAENVSLIKSIGEEYLGKVEQSVMRSITTGRGLEDLVPELEDYEGITSRRAKNIALDQTRKVYNNVNQARMQAIGVKKFMWLHSGGGAHPRELHVQMDGQVYSFDNLPIIDERTGEKGIPGQAINCRCTMSPVFDLDDEGEDDN
jgi:SPP1 gp7 family putative phage head morphogenesis protein